LTSLAADVNKFAVSIQPLDCSLRKIGFSRLAQAQIDRSDLLLCAPTRRRLGFGGIAGCDHVHVRDRAGDGNVFLRVMGGAERRIGHPAANTDDDVAVFDHGFGRRR